MDKMFVYCNALSGTGKSTVAVLAGLELLSQGLMKSIVYLMVPDDRSLHLGALPGYLDDKIASFTTPLYDAMLQCGLNKFEVDILREQELVVCSVDIGLRGVNLMDTFLIFDEGQSARFDDVKLILTRLHDSSKCIFIGCDSQNDNKKASDHAFERFGEHMCSQPWAAKCELKKNYRGKMSRWAETLEVE
jgi:phosphate starvation-inducible protein PhoH